MEEAAQREVDARMGGSIVAQRAVVQVGRSGGTPVQALEQAHEMRAVRALDGGPVGGRSGAGDRAGTGHRERRVDSGDVQDRLQLEVKSAGILAAVRDLQHSPAAVVVYQEG